MSIASEKKSASTPSSRSSSNRRSTGPTCCAAPSAIAERALRWSTERSRTVSDVSVTYVFDVKRPRLVMDASVARSDGASVTTMSRPLGDAVVADDSVSDVAATSVSPA